MATIVLVFLLNIIFGKILAESHNLVFTDHDVFITNSTSSYYDIPEDCSLFGEDFQMKTFNYNMSFNTTYNGLYWIGVKIELRWRVNPLGVIYNCESNSAGNITLDECIKKCESKSYLKHGPESCICTDESKIDDGVSNTQPCEIPDMGICSKLPKGCVVYKYVSDKDISCYTSYYYNRLKILVFETEKCTEKKHFGYVCSKGKVPPLDRNISWYDAFQLCKNNGDELMQELVTTDDQIKDGSTFWISYFQRPVMSWGKAYNPSLCVAATLSANSALSLTSKFCTENLHSLCHTKKSFMDDKNEKRKERTDSSSTWIAVGCAITVVLVIILVVVIIKRSIKHRHKKIYIGEDDERTSGPLYSDTVVSATQPSEYFLCPTYSDPIHFKQIDTSGSKETEYALVVKSTPQIITTPRNKKEPLQENPYQIPEC